VLAIKKANENIFRKASCFITRNAEQLLKVNEKSKNSHTKKRRNIIERKRGIFITLIVLRLQMDAKIKSSDTLENV
jgi:hypothetical protein